MWGGPGNPVGIRPCLEQVSIPLGAGTSTSPTKWGDRWAGEVAPLDLSWGLKPTWTSSPEAEERIPQAGREKIRRWWCRGEVGDPPHTGHAGAVDPCENAHRNSGKQSERMKERGRPGCLLHGSGDHLLLQLQVILIGMLALFGPALGGRNTEVSLSPARPASPKPPPGPCPCWCQPCIERGARWEGQEGSPCQGESQARGGNRSNF